ncbi:thiolase domain-containing protein [Candidatus Geothermarchaeota archaeon]|nr:MAG: thiolase domain-containing protein [Candidatus Geothermarchaeota archaeon]
MRNVAIIGVGMTKFGELWDKQLRDLFIDASLEAIKDAKVDLKDIQAIYIGNMSAGEWVEQEHIGPLMADYLGVRGIPSYRVESACASSGIAFKLAYEAVATGLYDLVLVGGVEKMTDVSTEESTHHLASAAEREYEAFFGVTFPSLYALMARRHMYEYGTTREQLALVAVKNHRNGSLNPKAHFRNVINIDTVLNSPIVADPLRLFDCSPISDGASAIVIASEDIARKYSDTPIYIIGSGFATDTIALHDRSDITFLWATAEAAKKAYKMADIEPNDIDVAEVHDCFTIAEIMAYEALGFAERGEGGKLIEEGVTELDGKIPVNPSGGLKAKGHPVGATGTAQIVELTLQLRGEAGKRQVQGAEIGLAHNMGGSGSSAVVHILSRVRR